MTDSKGKTQEKMFTVCGVRDGILFRFSTAAEPDAQKRSAQVCAAIEEKIKSLVPLLQAHGTVYIEGVLLGELQRLSMEQRLSKIANRTVCVRVGERRVQQGQAKVHIGTLRGGMYLRADGDLTVVGDVHPGARLEAGGCIVVLGKLQGTAFAGTSGAKSATIAAWQMEPQMLCVAQVQAVCEDIPALDVPVIARLCEGEIVFSDYHDKI